MKQIKEQSDVAPFSLPPHTIQCATTVTAAVILEFYLIGIHLILQNLFSVKQHEKATLKLSCQQRLSSNFSSSKTYYLNILACSTFRGGLNSKNIS